MRKHTDRLFDCCHCNKRNYFLVTVLKKDKKAFYLTQCPRCKKYDEVKEISEAEFETFKPRSDKEKEDFKK